ncbi:MAG: hypothetical protein ACYCV4_19695 [Dermatophilaceae bacterium]
MTGRGLLGKPSRGHPHVLARLVALLALSLFVGACDGTIGGLGSVRTGIPSTDGSDVQPSSAPDVFDPAILRSQVGALVQRVPKELDTRRLASSLVPPTNRWFSSLALGPHALPVFPLPMSFAETGTGFAFGVPTVSTQASVITGGGSVMSR